MSIMVTGKNSNNCLEGCRLPVTDSLITFQNLNSYRLEGVEMPYPKGKPTWNKGLRWSEDIKQKISKAMEGRVPWNRIERS